MASYSPSDLVLITGANGHVAQHVVDQYLAMPNGPRVRATVRSEKSVQQITTFYSKDVATGRLEVVRVADITQKDAFDDVVRGKAFEPPFIPIFLSTDVLHCYFLGANYIA